MIGKQHGTVVQDWWTSDWVCSGLHLGMTTRAIMAVRLASAVPGITVLRTSCSFQQEAGPLEQETEILLPCCGQFVQPPLLQEER